MLIYVCEILFLHQVYNFLTVVSTRGIIGILPGPFLAILTP